MKDPDKPQPSQEKIARALRKELNPAEEAAFRAELKANARLQAEFDEERRLEAVLGCLPDVPVSSNFTSLVLQAAEREEAKASAPSSLGSAGSWWCWFRQPSFRLATGLAASLALGLLLVRQRNLAERAEMAQTVGAFTEVATAMGSREAGVVLAFQDFDAIEKLALPAEAELDMDLLVALQK